MARTTSRAYGDIPVPSRRYESLVQTDEEVGTFDEARFSHLSYGGRIAKRLVMSAVAVTAVMAIVMQVAQWNASTQRADRSTGAAQAPLQETVAKYVDPCAITTASPCAIAAVSNPCGVFDGSYFAPNKSCCKNTCGEYCGAFNCQTAPVGESNCCTHTFTKLCGTAGAKAPCRLPKVISGSVQLRLQPLSAFVSNPAGLAAVKAALSKILGVPAANIEVATDRTGAHTRRLTAPVDTVNVNYKITIEAAAPLTPATISSKSAEMKPVLQTKLDSASLSVTVAEAVLPTPVDLAPSSGATTTMAVPTLPPPVAPTPSPAYNASVE